MTLSTPPQAILHIGLPKTATTALQRHYFPALPKHRFTYIGTAQPRPDHPSGTYKSIMAAVESPADCLADRVNDAQAMLAMLPQQKTLVFSEELITVDGVVSWQEKIDRLHQVFAMYTCTILITIREPVSGLFSLYVELYRSLERRFPTLVEFAESNQAQIFDFRYLAAVARQAFRTTSIVLIPFEDLKPGGGFLSRLSDLFEINPPSHLPKENDKKIYLQGAVQIPALSVRQGLDQLGDHLPFWAGRRIAGLTRRLVRPLHRLIDDIPLPGTERTLKIPGPDCRLHRYAESNTWLLKNHGIDYRSVTTADSQKVGR